jgi:tetratricopeptide (TPR) repeat protein
MINTVHKILACLLVTTLILPWFSGCAVPARKLDADALWVSVEQRQPAAIRSVTRMHQLQSDYKTIIRITPDASIRGRAYLGLAELDLALGNYKRARHNLVQALRFDLPPEPRRRTLLMLGDTLERHLDSSEDAIMAYQQIVNEHPQTLESEVAQLRLRMLHHEQ